jgi:hypothetical protein
VPTFQAETRGMTDTKVAERRGGPYFLLPPNGVSVPLPQSDFQVVHSGAFGSRQPRGPDLNTMLPNISKPSNAMRQPTTNERSQGLYGCSGLNVTTYFQC